MNTELIGRVDGFHGDMARIVCQGTPPPHDVHYISMWQLRSARIGDRVKLVYRTTGSSGLWVVAEVLS